MNTSISIERSMNNVKANCSYEASPLMQQINKNAKKQARAYVISKIKDPSDIINIKDLKISIEKQKILAQTQLNVAVQGKLEALKRAKDIMDLSNEKLINLASSLVKIDTRINTTSTIISDYQYLKRVHFAKENVNKIISQVKFFANIPSKVNELLQLLDSDPLQLREVYLETVKLQSLQVELLKGINKSNSNGFSHLDISDNSTSRNFNDRALQTIVENQLQPVAILVNEVKSRVIGNIEAFLELGLDDPAQLVMTFEIIEMHQEYIDRRVHSNEKEKYKDIFFLNNDISIEVQDKMKLIFESKVEHMIEACKLTVSYEKTPVTAILNAISQLLNLLVDFRNEILPCIPPYYNTLDTFLETFEFRIIPELKTLGIQDRNKLVVSDILEIIGFFDYYNYNITSLLSDIPISSQDRYSLKEFKIISDDLLNEYLFRIKCQVMDWFNNIQSLPMDIIKTVEGNLITSQPTEMFNVIYMQLGVAREKLPKEYLKDLVNGCIQVLREVQRQSYDKLINNWITMDVETLCCIINDNQRLQEKCDEFSEKVLPMISQDKDIEYYNILSAMIEEVGNEYVSIAVTSTSFLCRCILIDLQEPVFSKIFTPEWEGSGSEFVSILTATLEDYLNDIRIWLPSYFFLKFIQDLFCMVVGFYIMSIRKLANGSFHFISEIIATARVIEDKDNLLTYFEKYENIFIKSKATSNETINSLTLELTALNNVAVILSSTHISSIEMEVKALFEKYNGDGLKLVKALISSNPSLAKVDKQQNIDKVTKMFDNGVATKAFTKKCSDVYKDFDFVDKVLVKSTSTISRGIAKKASFWKKS